jgi:outer membrane protein assembly factor BamD
MPTFFKSLLGEAAISYETFRDLHPRHEKAAYAQFRVAKSYFKDMPSTVARDHASATRALEAYNEFLAKHPTDKDAEEAKKDIGTIREALAQKEIYIGDFYRRLSRPEAASPRYKKAADQFPDTEAAKAAQEKHQKSEAEIAKRAVDQP